MPLSKKRNKERMRATRVQPNEPLLDAVSPSVRREGYGKASSTVQPKQAKIAELRKLIASVQPSVQPNDVPLYNSSINKPGDRVMVKPNYGKKLVEIVIPELDDDGNPYDSY